MEPGTATRRATIAAATALSALAGIAIAPDPSKSAKLELIDDYSLQLSSANEWRRAVALCPGSLEPYGGAMSADPDPDPSGEGVYPHSYERLGAQSGFHSTPVLYDPTPGTTRSYQVKLQVLCGKKPGKLQDPHAIALDVPPGTSTTLVAKCPKKSVLVGGGFQRAAFVFAGGVYPTESHAISKTQWQASGTSFGAFGTDMVSIGYCMRSPKRKPLLQEVSASVAIAPQQVGFATTPACPSDRRMVYSGFDTNPKQSLFFADGNFNGDDTFTGSAYNKSAGPATLTVFGYCLKEKVIGGSLKKFTKRGPS